MEDLRKKLNRALKLAQLPGFKPIHKIEYITRSYNLILDLQKRINQELQHLDNTLEALELELVVHRDYTEQEIENALAKPDQY